MATRFTTRAYSLPPVGLPDTRSLSRGVTRHIAACLIVYALIQVWLVVGAVSEGAPRSLPYVAIGLMVFAVIPAARRVEQRWRRFAAGALPSRALIRAYRQDIAQLWAAAVMLPFLWVSAFVGATAVARVLG